MPTEKGSRRAAVAALAAEGLSQVQIAKRLGVSRQRVWELSRDLAQRPRTAKDELPGRIAALTELAAAGATWRDAAKHFGVGVTTVRLWVRQHAPALAPSFASDIRAERSAQRTAALKRCADAGLSRRQAARALGVSYTTVCRHIRQHMYDVEFGAGR